MGSKQPIAMPAKNILLTGRPRCGKTTMIINLIPHLASAGGFFTQEFSQDNQRIGFKIVTLDGKDGLLAKKGLKSRFRLGKYGVNIHDLEEIGVNAVRDAINTKKIIVVDEIGKMELFSENFRRIVLEALDSKRVLLATVKQKDTPFTKQIKRRADTVTLELKPDNWEIIFDKLAGLLAGNYIQKYTG